MGAMTTAGPTSGPEGERPAVPVLRRGMLREAARASDSYGLLLVLVFIDYLLLSVPWEGPSQVVVSTLFGLLFGLLFLARLFDLT